MLAGRNDARGRIRTRTGDALDVVSLLVGLRERTKWVLQPVLIRRDSFTKAICRLLRGGVDWPAEPRLNKQRLPCLTVAARRRLVAASGAAPDRAGL